jgi:hydrogenase-4 membrane subunit HyfE
MGPDEKWMDHFSCWNVREPGFLIIGGDLVRGMLNGLLAVVSLAIAVVCFIYYRQDASTLLIVLTIIFAVLMVVFGGMFLSGRVNKTEDIHITE